MFLLTFQNLVQQIIFSSSSKRQDTKPQQFAAPTRNGHRRRQPAGDQLAQHPLVQHLRGRCLALLQQQSKHFERMSKHLQLQFLQFEPSSRRFSRPRIRHSLPD